MANECNSPHTDITTHPPLQGLRQLCLKPANACAGVLPCLPWRMLRPRGLTWWLGASASCCAIRSAIISPLPLRVAPRWSRAAILRLHFLYNLQVFPPIRSSIKSNQICTVFFCNQCPGCEMHTGPIIPLLTPNCCGSGVAGF